MSISKATWQKLFSLAIQFKQQAPWEWMFDSDIFGVKNPETGVTCYCTIMGNAGEMFGMGIYVGTEGLDTLLELVSGEEIDELTAGFSQKCLMLAFENKEDLLEPEESLLRELKLSFKGKLAIPSFRDYAPGLFPWIIETEEQAENMIYAIEQAMVIAQKCQENPDFLLNAEEDDDDLFMVYVQDANDPSKWEVTWEVPEDFEAPSKEIEANEIYLRSNLDRIPTKANVNWLVDVFYYFEPVQDKEGERPYFPYMLLVLDAESSLIVGHEVFKYGNFETELQKALVKICRDNKCRPQTIMVGTELSMEYMQHFEKYLGAKLEFDEDLGDFFEELKGDLFSDKEDFE